MVCYLACFAFGVALSTFWPVERPDHVDDPGSQAEPQTAFLRNRNGPKGAVNVQTCVEVLARREGLDEMRGFQAWAREQGYGGSSPEINRWQMAKYCEQNGALMPPKYEQTAAGAEDVAEVNNRGDLWVMVGDKGGRGSFYKQRVNTVAIVLYIDAERVLMHDPNWAHDTEKVLFWISREQFENRFTGWLFAFRRRH